MRHHPISPVTEPLQYRAIGVVRGHYVPDDGETLTRGLLRTEDGSEIEAVVLGRVLNLIRRHLDLERPHLWVVYPRIRDEHLHLQIVGVWEPSTLATETDPADEITEVEAPSSTVEESADALPEGDDYFSVRGELIFTRPESSDLVIKIRQKPRADGSRPTPFKVQIRGDIPLEHLRHFVSLDLRRQGEFLVLERFEVIAPLPQRGNRGGKGKPKGDRGPARGASRSGPPAGPHRSAISRPGG